MTDAAAGRESASRTDAIDAVLAQLAAGQSFADIRRALVPGSWAPVLARVAVAGRFGQDVYDRLLSASGPGEQPALDDLAEAGLIVPVAGRPGWFSMPAEDRAIRAADLDDSDRITLETELGEWHLRRGDQLEAMPHLLNGRPDQGRELLESLLDRADAELNLPRCQDLLRAAQDSASSLGADLAEFIAIRTAYLNARSMWLPDYYQSVHFLPPPGLADRGRDFITESEARVWHITGQGGAGKTMQLKWLLSRHWVPRPTATPCARVDLDSVDPTVCARYPFLVFIMAADQLASQLPHNPFSPLLRSYQPFLRFAMRRAGQTAALDATQAARAARDVPRLFAECCRAADQPIVIVLDTLEELSLRYPAETAELVRQFRDVFGEVPGLRLLFAGRYEIPAVRQYFDWVKPRPVTLFSPEAAESYLRDIRGIADPVRRADLVRRAHGLPYILAMYADLVTIDPATPLDDIDAELEPRLVYLVERIIDRIPEPLVRWLLRYGWVPRRLTRTYVRDVLAPFLVMANADDRSLDDPMMDPITEWRGRRLFPTDLHDLQAKLDQAWDDLTVYVSESSWAASVPGDPDTIVLKAEMLAPMRAVLAGRPILRELHLRSADFYRDLARTFPAGRSWFLREMIFHLAQAGSPDLLARWQECVDQARESRDYAALADLGAEVTGPEYLDEAGTPRRREGADIVPAELVVEGRLWRAYAAQAQIVRLRDGISPGLADDPLWGDVRRELAAAVPLARPTLHVWAAERPGERGLLLIRAESLVVAALALADGDPRRAWDAAAELRDADDDIALCAAELQVAVAPLTGENVIPALESLIRRALNAGRTADAVAPARTLSDRLVSAGAMDSAVTLLSDVNRRTGSLTDTYLDVLVEQGTPAAVELTRSGYRELPPGSRLAVDRTLAKAYLALRQPENSLQLLAESERHLGELDDQPAQLRERAFCLEVKGIAYGTLLQLDEAAAAFEQSASLWLELGHPDGHLRSRRHHAEILLREAGDVTEALTQLGGLSSQLDDGAEPAAVQRLGAEALGLNGSPELAVPIIERLLTEAGPDNYRSRALAAVAGLVASADVDRFGPPLYEALIHIRPPSARLALLQELRWCPPLPAHPVLGALASQATIAGQPVRPEDAAVHWLQQAYVARTLLGGPDVRLPLTAALAQAPSGFLACEILRHFPADAPDQAVSAAEEYVQTHQAQDRTLAAMVHLRTAERHVGRSSPPDSIEPLIRRAEDELGTAGRPSCWLAETYELRGRIAVDPFEARSSLQSAQSLQSRLGNIVAVHAIQARLADADERAAEPVSAAPPVDATELVVLDLWAGPPRAGVPGVDLGTMQAALAFAQQGREAPVGPDPVVRVESPELEVLYLPWEFVAGRVYRAQPPAGSLKRDSAWLGWALETRGSAFSAQLREECLRVVSGQQRLIASLRGQVELALGHSGRRPRVVIIKSSDEAEESWGYSLGARGLDLLSSYLSAGWDAEQFDPASAQPRNLFGRRPFDVIHVTARMEVSGSSSWFDTSEEAPAVRGAAKGIGMNTGIFPTTVIGWLAEMNRSSGGQAPPPVVVLDPVTSPSSRGPGEILMHRNRFAASVYLDGIAMAVVATGLAGRDPLTLQQAWLDGVARGDSLEQVVHDLRPLADANAPPALFAPSRTFTLTRF